MAESASAKIQQEASSVIDVETKEEREQACIYKVPYPLRKLNEEAYTPQVISIGPIHHSNENFRTMQNYKESYLKRFVDRAGIDIEDLKRILTADVEKVRQCYEEIFTDFSSEDFVTMILTDASFIIEFFLRNRFRQWTPEDRIVLKPWLADRILLDFILLENQLPFFIIKWLYDDYVGFPSRPAYPSFVDLAFEYFDSYNKQKMRLHRELKILHFLDLLRNFFLPPQDRLKKLQRKPETVEHIYSATKLDGVGLKFEVDLSSNCLLDLDLHLDYKKRVLKIPRFTLDNDTELYVRNLLTLEQCHYPTEPYVTDHFILLDFLINREEDLDLLLRQGILVSGFGNKHATNFFNNLRTGIIHPNMSSKYYGICIDLKKFYETPDWAEYIRRTCFSTLLQLAALTVTILTLIQTVCSLISEIPHH